MKKPQKERCYLCLKEFDTKVMTDDHAPPKCIYPPGTPDRIYARACGPCNRSFMDDDNEFRNWLSTVASSSKSKKWIFDNKTVPSLKQDKRLLRNIQSRLSIGNVDLGGETARLPKCGHPTGITEAMFRRITKCLLTRFYPNYDYTNDAFLIRHMRLEKREHRFAFWQTIAPLLIDHRGEDVFVFWRGVMDDGAAEKNIAGVWVLLFYPDADLKGACFSVIHSH